jgi:hypothetical protein
MKIKNDPRWTRHWLSRKNPRRGIITAAVTSDTKGLIVDAAPIFRDFIGRNISKLIAWFKPDTYEKWKCRPYLIMGNTLTAFQKSRRKEITKLVPHDSLSVKMKTIKSPERKIMAKKVKRRDDNDDENEDSDLDWSVLDVDENELVEEWVNQPRNIGKFIREQADARYELDVAKSNLDLVRAKLDLNIRENPEEYDLPKVTEASIAGAITLQDEFQKAQKKVTTIKHRVDLLQGVITGLEHKKRALEKLVDLHMQDYYSTPKAKGENKEAMEDMETSAMLRRGRIKKKSAKKRSRD